jgi:hypothetical protein
MLLQGNTNAISCHFSVHYCSYLLAGARFILPLFLTVLFFYTPNYVDTRDGIVFGSAMVFCGNGSWKWELSKILLGVGIGRIRGK